MKDGGDSFARLAPAAAERTAQERHASAAVYHQPAEAIAAYAALERCAAFSPAQSPAWVSAWITETAPDFIVGTLSLDGVPSYAIAVEIVPWGPAKTARFMGGRHANGNFSPLALSASIERADLDKLIAEIGAARPDIDLLCLERMADTIQQRPNPLMMLPHRRSPNRALAVDLAGGFDAVLERTTGKHKRKRYRSQARKLEAAGGFRFVTAATPEEAARFLEAFFAMKRERFRKMGVPDVFAEPQVQRFFHRLFAEALAEQEPAFTLDALEVDRELRAVTGSSRCGDRLICEFGAIRDDELARHSPGDFLFFESIRQACAADLALYDFSVGDEPYKRLWSDTEISHYDVIVPMTARGKLLAYAMRATNQLKTLIKGNPIAWRLAKVLRKRNANEPRTLAAYAAERSGMGEKGGS